MFKTSFVLAITALLAGGCMAPVSVTKLKAAKNVAIVVAFEPQLVGQKVGITVFGNDGWVAENAGYDINGAALGAVKMNLNRDAKLVDGKDVGLVIDPKSNGTYLGNVKPLLAKLGREWGVDTIVFIHSCTVGAWVQYNVPISGVGHYDGSVDVAYWVMVASAYDCKSGQLTETLAVKHGRALSEVQWHKSWNEYSPGERRAVIRGLDAVLSESMPVLLTKLGLTNNSVSELPTETNFAGVALPPSFVPAGNELDIPQWASRAQAKAAVAEAFKSRGWTLTTDTEEHVVGVYRKGTKEAVCAVTITERKIILAPEGYQVQDDEKRVPVGYYKSWNSFLKESIVGLLMQVPAKGEAQ